MRKPFETWAVIYTFEHGEESFVEEARSLENAQQKVLKNGSHTRAAKLFELSEDEAVFVKCQRGAGAFLVGGSGIQERDVSAKPGMPHKPHPKTCEYTGSPIDSPPVDSERENWRRETATRFLELFLQIKVTTTEDPKGWAKASVIWADDLLEALEAKK